MRRTVEAISNVAATGRGFGSGFGFAAIAVPPPRAATRMIRAPTFFHNQHPSVSWYCAHQGNRGAENWVLREGGKIGESNDGQQRRTEDLAEAANPAPLREIGTGGD